MYTPTHTVTKRFRTRKEAWKYGYSWMKKRIAKNQTAHIRVKKVTPDMWWMKKPKRKPEIIYRLPKNL